MIYGLSRHIAPQFDELEIELRGCAAIRRPFGWYRGPCKRTRDGVAHGALRVLQFLVDQPLLRRRLAEGAITAQEFDELRQKLGV